MLACVYPGESVLGSMKLDITIPRVGESVQEAFLAQWYKQDGDLVHKDEPLFLLETDKVTLEIAAEADGTLAIVIGEEETVAVGTVVGTLDTDAAPAVNEAKTPSAEAVEETPPTLPKESEKVATPPVSDEFLASVPSAAAPPEAEVDQTDVLSPSVRRLVAEHQLDVSQIQGSGPGGRITKGDVLLYREHLAAESRAASQEAPPVAAVSEEKITRKPMSPIRKRIAARLLEAKHNTAMLTTFNEIDMSRVIELRRQYKELFQQKHGVRLGFMSFFVKASIEALKETPEINAFVEDDALVYHHYYHIGVAMSTERGLVVPVIRHADQLSFAEIEQAILGYGEKIHANRLELSDLAGGTFTISNGGVFGSLLSTPLLNMPQSGILGMHKIEKRPVVVDDDLVIRPMMYVALSYDHRIVDGKESVTFLKRVKECIENPERMLVEV